MSLSRRAIVDSYWCLSGAFGSAWALRGSSERLGDLSRRILRPAASKLNCAEAIRMRGGSKFGIPGRPRAHCVLRGRQYRSWSTESQYKMKVERAGERRLLMASITTDTENASA